MNKYIFVDLDETLIHTVGLHTGRDMLNYKKVSLSKHESYNTRLRGCSLAFLEAARKKAKVFMLTVATKDYALAMNEAFSLGFKAEDIYSREDVRRKPIKPLQIEPGAVWLFDNLPSSYNDEKCAFLAHLGPLNYVKVFEMDHYSADQLDKDDLLLLLEEEVK
jgi:hypothetical protein